jgi:hypothetical protein
VSRHLGHTRNAHLELLLPRYEEGARNWRWGLALKVRRDGVWRTVAIYAGRPRPDLRFGHGTFTLEAKTWQHHTNGGPGSGVPGSKRFVRLKIGTGYDPLVRGRPSRASSRRRRFGEESA